MKNKLLVVGTMAYDAIETPFDKVDRILGGAATYIALASSKFNIDCGLVSVIGDDFEASDLKILKDLGLNQSMVCRLEQKTGCLSFLNMEHIATKGFINLQLQTF